ncbi:hypothetical protein AHF37_06357 [Paragonimus kellicotti]|nr:hypothetical protein AHF37_06357 [Paragonimus kellicotti]
MYSLFSPQIGWQHRRVADLMRTHPKRITLRLRKRPVHTTDFPGFLGGGRRHRFVAPQNPTAGTLPQFTRAGNLFARTPKRRTPLQPPNEASMMNGTSESTDSALALSPTTNSIPEAPIYSPSSSSSSSRCASMKLNDLQHADPGLLDPSDSATHNTTFTSHSFPAIRMISSTPSTPLMAVRMKHREPSGERIINLSNSQGPASPVEAPGLNPFYVVNEWVRFVFASESELDRSKWMNVLGLASIGLTTELHHARIGGFHPGYVTTELPAPVEDSSNVVEIEDGSTLAPKPVVSPLLSSEERYRKKHSETSESRSLSKRRRQHYFPWSGGKQITHSPSPVDECESNIRSASLPMSQLSSSYASPSSSTRATFSTRRSPSVPIVIDYSESDDDADEDACHSRSESRNANQLSSSYESKPLRTDSKFSLPLLLPVTRSVSASPKGKIQILWSKSASQSRPNTGSPKSGAQLLAPVHDLRRRSQSPSPQSDLGMRAAQLVCRSKVPHPST